MFEKIFNHGEQPEEIKEPEKQPEVRNFALTDESGAVMTGKEIVEERKKNLEDPTRYRDLR